MTVVTLLEGCLAMHAASNSSTHALQDLDWEFAVVHSNTGRAGVLPGGKVRPCMPIGVRLSCFLHGLLWDCSAT